VAVSSTVAGLMASGQGCSAGCGPRVYLATAPAIYGYGYRATYYGNGFAYQPAYYHPRTVVLYGTGCRVRL